MPTSQLTAPTKLLIDRLCSQLLSYQNNLEGIELRERVLRLLEVQKAVRKLGVALAVDAGLSSSGAKERLRGYLLKYKGHVIEADELSAISGVSEYGRRVRELRENEGFKILTGPAKNPKTGQPLRPDQYLLVD